jgi:methionyl-tRNA formyltransferase
MGAVFLGTPAAAVPSLAALADVADVDLVITRPDRRSGRGGSIATSPVKVASRQFGFEVAQPATRQELADLLVGGGFAFGLVVAYGMILTPTMLTSTDMGFLNVHFSLLPRWRGAAPVERAIAAGDERTGVTLMRLDEGIDTGPILGEVATPIAPGETGGSLTARLAHLGAALVDSLVPDYLNGRRHPVPQFETETTQAAPLTKADAQLSPTWPVARAERAIRAFHPRPGAWLSTPEGAVRVLRGRIGAGRAEPGVISVEGASVVAGFADGALQLGAVQPPGRSPMEAKAWMNGRRGVPTTFSDSPE